MKKTKASKHVVEGGSDEPQCATPPAATRWEWLGDEEEWTVFAPEHCAAIATAFKQKKPEVIVQVRVGMSGSECRTQWFLS